MVLRPRERQCAAGVRDHPVDVPTGLGDRGPVHRDHGREERTSTSRSLAASASEPAARMVDGRIAPRPASAASSHASTPSTSPSVSRLHPTHAASSGRRRTTSSGSAASQSSSVRLAVADAGRPGELDEVGGVLVVTAGDGVPDGVGHQPVLREPSAGRRVQLGDPVGVLGGQTGTQGVGEEMVVAVPPPLVVERDDEQVLAVEGLQHRLTVGTTGQRVAQAAGQLVQHAGI